MNTIPTLLVIGGSDSSGGAGIQADCAMARACRVMPVCAVSCVTCQGLGGLKMLQPVEPDIFRCQIVTTFEELHPRAVKIGMIPNEELIGILIEVLEKYRPDNVVLDPVMATTSGNLNLCKQMWRNPELLGRIAPLTTLITPNIPEALSLIDAATRHPHLMRADSREDLREIIELLYSEYHFRNILLKGGHSSTGIAADTLYFSIPTLEKEIWSEYVDTKISTPNTHGSGCALSSGIAVRLAKGEDLKSACWRAVSDLRDSLRRNADNIFFDTPGCYGPAYF